MVRFVSSLLSLFHQYENVYHAGQNKIQLQIGNKIENNRPASNYRHYRSVLIRKQYGRRTITDITDSTGVTDLIKNGIGMMMVGCSRRTYPSIHLFVSKSRSVVRGAVVCCVCMRVLCCVVCCVVWCGVVWCGVVWCGVYFCVFLCCCFFSFFSQLSSFSFFLLSSLFSSRHQTPWKEPINQHGGQHRGI